MKLRVLLGFALVPFCAHGMESQLPVRFQLMTNGRPERSIIYISPGTSLFAAVESYKQAKGIKTDPVRVEVFGHNFNKNEEAYFTEGNSKNSTLFMSPSQAIHNHPMRRKYVTIEF